MIRKIFLSLIVILLLLACGMGEVLCAKDQSSPVQFLVRSHSP